MSRERDGAYRGAKVLVHLAGLASDVIAVHGVDSDGAFDFTADIPSAEPDSNQVVVLAELRNDGRVLRSHPHVLPLGIDGSGLVLPLLEAGTVVARAINHDGEPVPGARLIITELPQTTFKAALQPWEVNGANVVDVQGVADADGRVRATVREGHVEIRASGNDGVYGKPERSMVHAGQVADLGDVVVGREARQFEILVIDAAGAPVSAAWVRVSDRTLRFGHRQASDEIAHFRTNRHGRLRLGRIPASRLPIFVAVGSPHHRPVEAVLDGSNTAPREVRVQLEEFFSFEITVVTESGSPLNCPVQWHLERLAGTISQEESPVASRGQLTPIEVFREYFEETIVVPIESTAGRYKAYVNQPGEYILSGMVAGGLGLDQSVKVAHTTSPSHVELSVPDGRAVTVRLRSHANKPALTWPAELKLLWLSSFRPDLPQIETSWFAAPGKQSDKLWIPAAYDRLRVQGRNAVFAPWQPTTLSIPKERPYVVEVGAPAENATRLDIYITHHGRRLRVPNLAILVAGRVVRANGVDKAMFTVRTGKDGAVHLLLAPGTYEARLFPGVGPAKWQQAELLPGKGTEVDLQLN